MHTPKMIQRSTRGQTKFGNARAGVDAAHIMSYEVFNAALQKHPGPMYSQATQQRIQRELNQQVRIKSHQGNMYGTPSHPGDRKIDQQIISAMRDPKNKNLTNQDAVDRMRRQWQATQKMDLPPATKMMIRKEFSQIKDQNGHSIVRANAALDA